MIPLLFVSAGKCLKTLHFNFFTDKNSLNTDFVQIINVGLSRNDVKQFPLAKCLWSWGVELLELYKWLHWSYLFNVLFIIVIFWNVLKENIFLIYYLPNHRYSVISFNKYVLSTYYTWGIVSGRWLDPYHREW